MKEKKQNTINVSKEFVEIYKLFNVNRQSDNMKLLSRKELLLLLILSIDSFSEENSAVIENCKDFKDELLLINDLQEDKECTDQDLLDLGKITNESYIDTSMIRDLHNSNLPTPLTDEEALKLRRDIGISDIIN